jgi:bifunctional DNA-binding transcriptional regulator/antitoxin component of YhaV-PrlF toxin-antitoxin module
MNEQQSIVTVTSKGQATIPKHMRERHKIGRKALVVDTPRGILVKPVPSPASEKGSLKGMISKSSAEIMSEVRKEESGFDHKLTKKIRH